MHERRGRPMGPLRRVGGHLKGLSAQAAFRGRKSLECQSYQDNGFDMGEPLL